MSTHKRIDIICIAAVVFTIVLTVLFMNGEALGLTPIPGEGSGSGLFTDNDLYGDWDTSSATRIILSDGGGTIIGNGAYVYRGDIYIAYAGRYVLTGELTGGSIIVDADKSDKIWISLDGVTISRDDDAAIRVEQADKVFLTLAEGTTNTITCGAEYRAEAVELGVDGAIYSRDDLTINGSGTLVVEAAYSHGIVCNDDLVITGGGITVTAAQDGIHANDSVRIRDASLSISAGDDGITVSNDEETAFLYVESGSIAIPACYEGLEAIDITIAGGNLNITATDDGINANGSGTDSVIRITGGDITVTNPSGRDGDGLDSNGSIYIEGGRLFISVSGDGGNCALDYGSENGGECVISGGTVIACGGSAMAEGFDAASPQGFLMYGANAAAGTAVTLTDSDGNILLSQEIPYNFSSVVLSTPELSPGDVCTITVGDKSEQVTIDNTASSGFGPVGMFGGGMHGGRGSDAMTGDREFGAALPFAGREDWENAAPPEGMEPQTRTDKPEGEGRPDRPGTGEGGGRSFTPDGGQAQEEGARPMRQEWEQMNFEEDRAFSSLSAGTWILLGVSASVLLAGLLIALKIKHFY